jgi:hypothetical protein
VVKTAEYENYEVVLDEVHLARESDIKNTRERLIDAMTETIHGKVKAYLVELWREAEAAMAEQEAKWQAEREARAKAEEPEVVDREGVERMEAAERMSKPDGGFKGLELDPTKPKEG